MPKLRRRTPHSKPEITPPSHATSGSNALTGKVALITGATQGIGLAIARTLAEHGCDLVVSARDENRLSRVESDLSSNNTRTLSIPCDVRDESSVKRMFAKVSRQFGHLDILINNAGIAYPFRPVPEVSLQEWNDVLATNLTGTFLVTKAALPLLQRGASIVNVLSMSSKRAFPNLAAYNASKFGALGFTNTLREELRSEGIRVIALLPGSTDTPIWNTLWPQAPRQKMIRPQTVAEALIAALKAPPESTIEEINIMPTSGPL